MKEVPFTPTYDWGAAPLDSLIWIGDGLGHQCGRYPARARHAPLPDQVGTAVLAHHPGLFRWPTVDSGVGDARGAAACPLSCGVRLDVLFSYFSNDLYTSLQKAFEGQRRQRCAGLRNSRLLRVARRLLVAGDTVDRPTGVGHLSDAAIHHRWRVWLTDQLTGDWLDGRAYYRGRFIDDTIDNPDQRIQQDVDVFTAGVGGTPNEPANNSQNTLLFGAIDAVVSVASFGTILWDLSRSTDVLRHHPPQGHVLDGHPLRVDRDDRRVLDRAPIDPLQLPQRKTQRCFSVCAGPLP